MTGTLTENGFISNAKWKGVRIRDVLIDAGYDENNSKFDKYKYVTFYGLDTDLSCQHFAMSTPINHIMDKTNDCILAFEMNGKELPKDHGYPIRVLLPGIVGCRNVKWLGKIQLTQDTVDSHWQKNMYKIFGNTLYDMPVTSVITKHNVIKTDNDDDNNKLLEVKGYAWSGGGRGIIKVEISIDNGETWKETILSKGPIIGKTDRNRDWSWTLWHINIDLKDIKYENNDCDADNVKVICRAMDSSFNSQPQYIQDIVNGTDNVNNSWHSINIKL